MSREGEIPSRVEEQELPTEAVHDESPQARQNDQRCHVRHFCVYNIYDIHVAQFPLPLLKLLHQ